jgi:hypothetical protein
VHRLAFALLVKNKPVFAAVHESLVGTNRTNRAGQMMSVDRGKPEIIGGRSKRRD